MENEVFKVTSVEDVHILGDEVLLKAIPTVVPKKIFTVAGKISEAGKSNHTLVFQRETGESNMTVK